MIPAVPVLGAANADPHRACVEPTPATVAAEALPGFFLVYIVRAATAPRPSRPRSHDFSVAGTAWLGSVGNEPRRPLLLLPLLILVIAGSYSEGEIANRLPRRRNRDEILAPSAH